MPVPGLGEVIDRHHSIMMSPMLDELAARMDSEVREVRRLYAESVNQALRRFRLAGDDERILQLLHASCEPYAAQSVVLVFENNQARILPDNGADNGAARAAGPANPAFSIDGAQAILAVIESRDPVVAVGSADQISAVAVAFAGGRRSGEDRGGEDRKAYLFPVVARQSVVGMLIASGAVDAASIELLCGVAAMRLESIANQTLPAGVISERRMWDDLSADDQKLHLQAQRMAKVRVAEMRVYQGDAMRSGISGRNVYGALESRIDAARREFRQAYLSKSPTMVDYLHLEILRNLAQDDPQLLGQDYPGPMV